MSEEKKEFNPWQGYFPIAAGILAIAMRFFDDLSEWTTIDLLKVGVGVALIAYGAYKLITKK